MALDVNALVQKAKADAAAAEAAATAAKAQAAQNKSQTAQANKIQTQANQKFDYAKNLKSSLQGIEDEIMAFVTRLSRGDTLSKSEQSRLDNLGKQYDSVAKNYTNTLKQGNDLLATLPVAPSVPSAAPKAGTTGTQLGTGATAGATTVTVDSANAQLDGLLKTAREDIAKMTDADRINLAKTLTSAGYKTPEIGKFNDTLVLQYQAALTAAKNYNTTNKDIIAKNILKPLGFTDFLTNQTSLINAVGGTGGAGGAAKAGTFTRTLPSTTNADDAKATITKLFQSTLNRLPSSKELAAAIKALNAHEAANPLKEKYTIDSNGNIVNRATTGGSNADQFILDYIQADKTLGAEYNKVKQTAPDLNTLAANKKLFEDAVKAAGNDLAAIQKAKETTAYGRGLKELETQLQDKFMKEGAINDPGDVARLAQELYDKGLNLNDETGLSLVESQMKFGPGKTNIGGKDYTGYTGKAGQNVDALRSYALNNGLKLEDVFGPVSDGSGNSLDEVLSAVNRGEPIDTYARIIRDAAKAAWKVDKNVADLMDQGVSLNSIYSPYKNAYADTLELNPEQVTLNDLTKYNVIGGDGTGGNLFDFRKTLRKDPRWQYTQQANQEVAGAVQQVLRDFGFMG